MRSVFLCIIIGGFVTWCCTKQANLQNKIFYPSPVPDSVALTFLPGVVSTDSLDFNAAFSEDGSSFYFSRSRYGKYDILICHWNGKGWGKPVLAPFSEKAYAEADPVFGPDGSIYFISDRPRDKFDTTGDFDIWRVQAGPHGQWSAPENVEAVNSDSSEYYVSFAENGNLYFASDRAGGYGSHDIYMSRLDRRAYQEPRNLGLNINAAEMDHDPLVSKDEQILFFTSVNRDGGFGEGDLYYSKMDKDGNWRMALNMGPQINTATYEYCPYLSPDTTYFFFSSDFDVKWVSAHALEINESGRQ